MKCRKRVYLLSKLSWVHTGSEPGVHTYTQGEGKDRRGWWLTDRRKNLEKTRKKRVVREIDPQILFCIICVYHEL